MTKTNMAIEPTEQMLAEAEAFWEYARCRTLRIADDMGIEIEDNKELNGFLYDTFDDGSVYLSDDEIAEAVMEYASYDLEE